MRRKFFIVLLTIISTICLALGLTACGDSGGGSGGSETETISVTSVSLDNSLLNLIVDDIYSLTATVSPSNATNKNVTWSSSNTSVATVSSGKITAVSAGSATITVKTEDGGYTATCSVKVTEATSQTVSVTSVSLNYSTLSLEVGKSSTLSATILPSNATNKNVTWSSSNSSVATVSSGKITAVSAGTAVIIVTTSDGGKVATCTVTVTEPVVETIAVTSVSLNTTSLSLNVGDTTTLTATVLPSNATNTDITWSSSENSVATVDNGIITAISAGTATITVTTEDGNYTADCIVTVEEETPEIIGVTSVSLNTNSLLLTVGGSSTLIATVLPSNATNQNVIWESSDTSVAIVTNGIVTAISAGTATITVTTEDGNYTNECIITVNDETPETVAVTSVNLDITNISLEVGGTYTLTATVSPQNATNQNITWSSSDNAIATVSDGIVAAISEGTVTITVTTEDGGYTAECVVTITEPPVSVISVSLEYSTLSLYIGDTTTLTAIIYPSNATNQNVTWSSSDNTVATVSDGVVAAVSAGTVIITVTTEDGGYTAICTVVVTEPTVSVTSVSLDNTSISLNIGDTTTLTATTLPSNATNQNVTWSSSNTAVATINNGTVTAIAAGTAIITVTTEDGNYTATCTVSVEAATAAVLSVDNATINGNEIYLLAEHTTTSISLSGAVTCSNNSSWKLYASDAITEIPTKVITSLANGTNTYYIVVTSTSDSTVSKTYILTVYKSFAVTVNYYNGSNKLYSETAYTGYTYFADYVPDITGYTFNYWKTSGGQAYSATIILADLNLYAETTVNNYTVTYDANNGILSETQKTVIYNESYTLAIPERTGYTFNGWYYGSAQLTNENGNSLSVWKYTENITVIANWTVNNYTVTLNRSDSSAGTVSGGGSYTYGSSVTITATTNSGYTWVGWYNGDIFLTNELSYTFTMSSKNVTYTAKWSNTTITTNYSSAGSIFTLEDTYIVGDTVTISATDNNYIGYTWIGWYKGDTLYTTDYTFDYTMGAENVTFTATYEVNSELSNFEFTSTTTTCTITGITDNTITEIIVPDYVISISEGAFNGCSSLESITLPFAGSSTNATSASSSTLFGYIFGTNSYTGGTSTKQYYSSGNYITYCIPTTLKSVKITKENILYGTFYNCTMLTSITISDSVTSINNYAFYNCTSLESITIPDSITSIGGFAFYNCSSLESITIPDSVTSISIYAFYNCTALTEIYFNATAMENLNSSNNYVFFKAGQSGDGITVTIGANVTKIPACLFYPYSYVYYAPNIVSVIFENNSVCESIGTYAFWGCTSLTSVIV